MHLWRIPSIIPYLTPVYIPLSAAPSFTGTGSLTTEVATIVGVGAYSTPTKTATGSLLADVTTIVGVGVYSSPLKTATGDLQVTTITIAGVGTITGGTITGTGDLQQIHTTIVGVGTYATPEKTGTGSLATDAATIAGSGMVSLFGSGSLATVPAYLGSDTGGDTGTGGTGINIPVGGFSTNGPGNRYGAPGVHHRRPSRKV